jgi:hypothetical protein
VSGKALRVDRATVIAYRIATQGLHRDRGAGRPEELQVLDIGVQDSGTHSAWLALDARLPTAPDQSRLGPGQPLALAWTLRGAPYVHRRADLDTVAGALWPLSEADAAGRLNETRPSVAKAGIAALDQFRLAVDGLRGVVRAPTGKGAASTAVTKQLPPAMRRECRGCKTRHISDSAMRAAALPAGLELEPDTAPPVLRPRPKARRPREVDLVALADLVRAYLTVLGPATDADVADYLAVRRADLAQVWPDDLVPVSVDGRDAWLPPSQVAALRAAAPRKVLRLLGPFDPYLQARDRTLIVPDGGVHKALWPVLGRPGVVLADGEVVGSWRTRSAGPALTIAVDQFVPLAPAVRAGIEAEAERVGAVRGAAKVRVTGLG